MGNRIKIAAKILQIIEGLEIHDSNEGLNVGCNRIHFHVYINWHHG